MTLETWIALRWPLVILLNFALGAWIVLRYHWAGRARENQAGVFCAHGIKVWKFCPVCAAFEFPPEPDPDYEVEGAEEWDTAEPDFDGDDAGDADEIPDPSPVVIDTPEICLTAAQLNALGDYIVSHMPMPAAPVALPWRSLHQPVMALCQQSIYSELGHQIPQRLTIKAVSLPAGARAARLKVMEDSGQWHSIPLAASDTPSATLPSGWAPFTPGGYVTVFPEPLRIHHPVCRVIVFEFTSGPSCDGIGLVLLDVAEY